MKLSIATVALTLASTATAFAPSAISRPSLALRADVATEDAAIPSEEPAADIVEEPAKPVFSIDTIPGAVAPLGLFDPLGFAKNADEMTLRKYRESELIHGRVGMLAAVGFLVGEAVQGSTVLFNGEVTGPAINHLPQVNPVFWIFLMIGIANAEWKRAEIGWVEPGAVKFDQPGQLRDDYIPGDIGFDPLGLKPTNEDDFFKMQTKELQNGRLGMLAAAGFMAQELANGKGILENLGF